MDIFKYNVTLLNGLKVRSDIERQVTEYFETNFNAMKLHFVKYLDGRVDVCVTKRPANHLRPNQFGVGDKYLLKLTEDGEKEKPKQWIPAGYAREIEVRVDLESK